MASGLGYSRKCRGLGRLLVSPEAMHWTTMKCDEKMGNLEAPYKSNPQYAIGITMYIINMYPAKMLTMAKKGQMRGLNKKDATADQSRVIAPTPRPLMPDPICWAVTDLENAQQIHEMLVSVENRYPGTKYQQKLHINAMRKNFALDMRRSSFSCKALQRSMTRLNKKITVKQFTCSIQAQLEGGKSLSTMRKFETKKFTVRIHIVLNFSIHLYYTPELLI